MYLIYLIKKIIIAIDQSYKTYINHKILQTININIIYPESPNAHKWLDGLNGIEIGPSLVNSFGIKSKTLGLQFDGYDNIDHEITGKKLNLDFISPADIIPIQDEAMEFLLSSHVIEHCPNFIKTLIEWYRVLKYNNSFKGCSSLRQK